jgi:hypothetical protein
MNQTIRATALLLGIALSVACASAQGDSSTLAAQLAELNSLKDKIKSADTRTRVNAFHQVWTIALASESVDVKLLALDLMKEPAASASDHIRMPAVYAIAEVANSTADTSVKTKALASLKEPIVAGQLPVRLAAIDAVNSIMRSPSAGALALQAIELLAEPVRSGNNGVRIPAINAVSSIALATNDDRVSNAAIDLMKEPLESAAAIGGMEVRMMAVVEVERLGIEAPEVATKAKAMGMLQAYADNNSWEPEARRRAADGAARIQSTLKTPSKQKHKTSSAGSVQS